MRAWSEQELGRSSLTVRRRNGLLTPVLPCRSLVQGDAPMFRFFETPRSLRLARHVNCVSTKGAESQSPGSRSAPWGNSRSAQFVPKGLEHRKAVGCTHATIARANLSAYR